MSAKGLRCLPPNPHLNGRAGFWLHLNKKAALPVGRLQAGSELKFNPFVMMKAPNSL